MKKLMMLFFCTMTAGYIYSQNLSPDVTATAGDFFVGPDATLSWTLGEIVIETFTGGANILTQGFQQPSYQVVSINEPDDASFSVSVYPNPARDFIFLSIVTAEETPLFKVVLYDFIGNTIFDQDIRVSNYLERINLSQYATNIFLLKITDIESKTTRTFKIMKVRF